MTFEADFRTFLLSSGTIAGLVGDRIVWSELPSGSPLPLVTLWTMSSNPEYTMAGANGLEQRRVQCDCWAMTLAEAKALDGAIAALVDGFRGTVGQTFLQGAFVVNRDEGRDPSMGSPAQRYFRARIDLLVWFGAV
jgi:hypothetical protein